MLFQILFGNDRVVACTVHERPDPPSDRIDRAEALRFIRDGFAAPIAVIAPLWLAAQRLWLGLGLYLLGALAIAAAYFWFGLPQIVAVIAVVAMHVIVGFEADAIERADIERKGWSTLGSVTGASLNECQRRFFDQWLLSQPVLAARGKTSAPPPPPASEAPAETKSAWAGQTAAARLAALWKGKPS